MRLTIAVLALFMIGACSKGSKAAPSKSSTGEEVPSGTQGDADLLGREIFDLVDQAMGYKGAHRGRLPKSLKELGVDALTGTTSRTLSLTGNVPEVTVAFRAPAGRMLSSCRGTNAVLEEASLSEGEFSVICTLTSGGTTTLRTKK